VQRLWVAAPHLGQFNGPHSITVDQEGNPYLAEVFNGRAEVSSGVGCWSRKAGRAGTAVFRAKQEL